MIESEREVGEGETGERDGEKEEERKKIVSHHLFDCCGF